MKRIVVIGGGAAGMMAAGTAAENIKALQFQSEINSQEFQDEVKPSGNHRNVENNNSACLKEQAEVILLEKNEKLGKKIYITGKGRCNFTNIAERDDFFKSIVTNSKFMYSSFSNFDNYAMISFVEENGVKTKVERGGRAFPISDHASDITKALTNYLKKNGVKIRLDSEVAYLRRRPAKNVTISVGRIDAGKNHINSLISEQENLEYKSTNACVTGHDDINDNDSNNRKYEFSLDNNFSAPGAKTEKGNIKKYNYQNNKNNQAQKSIAINPGFEIHMKNGEKIEADCVIIATGGLSYKTTGSTGDGYHFAKDFGLEIVPQYPSLVPMNVKEDYIFEMQGLSLKNVSLKIFSGEKTGQKKIFEDFGEMMFTHFGVTGPMVLSASSYINKALEAGPLHAEIDLKPAVSEKELDERLQREIEAAPKKEYKNLLAKLMPKSMIPVFAGLTGTPESLLLSYFDKDKRRRILSLLKAFPFTITSLRDYNEAVITKGGVSVKDISPRTMEVKNVPGLFFAGEVLDVDALTGGFNLQIAWSTGYAAGKAAAGKVI